MLILQYEEINITNFHIQIMNFFQNSFQLSGKVRKLNLPYCKFYWDFLHNFVLELFLRPSQDLIIGIYVFIIHFLTIYTNCSKIEFFSFISWTLKACTKISLMSWSTCFHFNSLLSCSCFVLWIIKSCRSCIFSNVILSWSYLGKVMNCLSLLES